MSKVGDVIEVGTQVRLKDGGVVVEIDEGRGLATVSWDSETVRIPLAVLESDEGPLFIKPSLG